MCLELKPAKLRRRWLAQGNAPVSSYAVQDKAADGSVPAFCGDPDMICLFHGASYQHGGACAGIADRSSGKHSVKLLEPAQLSGQPFFKP